MIVKITFDSPFMKNDSIVVYVESLEKAIDEYLNWWKGYGKDEDYANKQINDMEVLDKDN